MNVLRARRTRFAQIALCTNPMIYRSLNWAFLSAVAIQDVLGSLCLSVCVWSTIYQFGVGALEKWSKDMPMLQQYMVAVLTNIQNKQPNKKNCICILRSLRMFIITNLLFHFHLAGFRKKNSKFIINYNMVAARDRECASQPTSNPAINSLREKRCFFFFFYFISFST